MANAGMAILSNHWMDAAKWRGGKSRDFPGVDAECRKGTSFRGEKGLWRAKVGHFVPKTGFPRAEGHGFRGGEGLPHAEGGSFFGGMGLPRAEGEIFWGGEGLPHAEGEGIFGGEGLPQGGGLWWRGRRNHESDESYESRVAGSWVGVGAVVAGLMRGEPRNTRNTRK